MRTELQLIEKIESYLAGQLNEEEVQAFEQQISNDPTLRAAVAAQQDLMQGMNRAIIKQEVQQAGRRYHSGRRATLWSIGGMAVLLIAAVLYFAIRRQHQLVGNAVPATPAYIGTMLPLLNEEGKKEWATADSVIPAQAFELDAARDTIIETTGGIVMAIPAYAFQGKDGTAASGKIMLYLKEALDPFTIMRAGLSTMSGEKLLETGGMFFLDARQGDRILRINPAKGIYAELPGTDPKPGMQLFKGKRLADGKIDWINPVPLPNELIPIDITGLDFYPPEYLHMLSHAGYPITNKSYTDSVYYSLAGLFRENEMSGVQNGLSEEAEPDGKVSRDTATSTSVAVGAYLKGKQLFHQKCGSCHNPVGDATGPALKGMAARVPGKEWLVKWIHNPPGMIASGDKYAVELYNKWKPTVMTAFPELGKEEIDAILKYAGDFDGMCGINPAKIKAIWNDKFQNTLLATREFEQRMKLIHTSKDPALLDVYVNNLDKPLYQIDSMAAAIATDGRMIAAFRQAAALRNGKVKTGFRQFDRLKAYYARKTKLFTEAIAAAQLKIRIEQERSDQMARQKALHHQADEAGRVLQNFEQELELNLESAYKQLGMPRPTNLLATAATRYSVMVTNTGWNNVDKYVAESAASRSTLDYTDPQSGKKAVIEYKPLTVSINNAQRFDRVLVYLLPDGRSSFMNMKQAAGKFSENLNSLMKYDLVCIGIRQNQYSFLHLEKVQAKAYEGLMLKAIDSNALDRAMNRLSMVGQATAVRKEIEYALWDIQNTRQQRQRQQWEALMDELKQQLFGCDRSPGVDSLDYGVDRLDYWEAEMQVK